MVLDQEKKKYPNPTSIAESLVADGADPNDASDPHNWSETQLRAYLHTTAPAGRAAKQQATAGTHEELVRRCCQVI